MKPITKPTKTPNPDAGRTTTATTAPDPATPPKAQAQCCAKVSSVTMGCHN
jgi:hypothetical protein